ncbi:PEP-CTERM sorting domain-containing protein [Pelomonas cellulosilytica]|uniref:PEP-CTERM sorting domain-containing protein n=1 Tax=Pelomonas cellulosilytica TaxID=2906762 RepID=A0ABS8XVJ9_9BURK|nr:PEP-CTERM sorting domain-containing protein [Pelomonas sp. P8]MCE4556682.1 PEP-CTERM sorting domain-containing protein [Pelomonas sp. P8]
MAVLHRHPSCLAVAAALAASLAAPAHAGSLDTYAGGVGGIARGSVDSGCYTSGTPDALKPFFSGGSFPAGGIAACGLTGGLDQDSGSSGRVASTYAVGPVKLGIPEGHAAVYSGQADAFARYGWVGVSAAGQFAGGVANGGPGTYDSMVAAAKFTDTLTATSASVAQGSKGYVRYAFELSGSASAPGALAPYFTGSTVLDLLYMNSYQPVKYGWSAQLTRGSTGFFSYRLVPDGWTTTPGMLSGSSTFYSEDLPIVWGQSWDLTVGLVASAYGDVTSNFMSGARLVGVQLFDSQHQAVGDSRLLSASGTDYLAPVPEAASGWMMLAGLGGLLAASRRRSSCAA